MQKGWWFCSVHMSGFAYAEERALTAEQTLRQLLFTLRTDSQTGAQARVCRPAPTPSPRPSQPTEGILTCDGWLMFQEHSCLLPATWGAEEMAADMAPQQKPPKWIKSVNVTSVQAYIYTPQIRARAWAHLLLWSCCVHTFYLVFIQRRPFAESPDPFVLLCAPPMMLFYC